MKPPQTAAPDLQGLADLTAILARCANVSGVLLYVDPDIGDNARAYVDDYTGTARVDVGAELLTHRVQSRLYGVLAHEVAHHALGHADSPVWRDPVRVTAGAALVALAGHAPLVVVALLVVAATAAHLWKSWRSRRQEFDADALAFRLLDAAGFDGHLILAIALATAPSESRWYARGGWLLGTHPTHAARRRLITRLGNAGGAA